MLLNAFFMKSFFQQNRAVVHLAFNSPTAAVQNLKFIYPEL